MKPASSTKKPEPKDVHLYIVGGGIAGMAVAAFAIRKCSARRCTSWRNCLCQEAHWTVRARRWRPPHG
jgi:hypothetical protein